MVNLSFILMVLAVVCLALAAGNVPTGKISVFPLGMLFWALAVTVIR